jgi:hypothetical protein
MDHAPFGSRLVITPYRHLKMGVLPGLVLANLFLNDFRAIT